jgi:hypothetical protein
MLCILANFSTKINAWVHLITKEYSISLLKQVCLGVKVHRKHKQEKLDETTKQKRYFQCVGILEHSTTVNAQHYIHVVRNRDR